MSIANLKAEEPAGTQEGVVFIYKVNLSFKVFAIFTEKMSTMRTSKGVIVLRRGAENGKSQDVSWQSSEMLDSQGTLVMVLAPLGVVLRVLMLFVGKAHFCDKEYFWVE